MSELEENQVCTAAVFVVCCRLAARRERLPGVNIKLVALLSTLKLHPFVPLVWHHPAGSLAPSANLLVRFLPLIHSLKNLCLRQLLPGRLDWLGKEHPRTYEEVVRFNFMCVVIVLWLKPVCVLYTCLRSLFCRLSLLLRHRCCAVDFIRRVRS